MAKANEAQIVVQVDEQIDMVVSQLESGGKDLVIPHIANTVYSKLDAQRVAPHVVQYLSIQEIKQRARAFLRHRHEPEERARRAVESGQEDMFAQTLQDYYPVKRDVMGERQRLYVPRQELEDEEIEEIADRLRRTGGALIKHSDSLIAYSRSR